VGDAFYNRKTWTTIGAVDKRVTESAVSRVKQFPQAIRAAVQVRGDGQKVLRIILARYDFETLKMLCRYIGHFESIDLSPQGWFFTQFLQESLQPLWIAVNFNFHAVRRIKNPAGQAMLMRVAINR